MHNARILTVGVLALVAVLVISATITALAPYVATFTVVCFVCWLFMDKDDAGPPTKIE